jgi:hypothetical protein
MNHVQDITEFRDLLFSYAKGIQKRLEEEKNLTDPNRKRLSDQASDVLDQVDVLNRSLVLAITDDAKSALDSLNSAKLKLNKAVSSLKNIQKVISLSGKIIKLTADLISQNYPALLPEAQAILKFLEA